MPDPSAGEVGGIFAGLVALCIALGKAIGWLINLEDRRQSTRHAKLDAWQQELQSREQRIDTAQAAHEQKLEGKLAKLATCLARMQRQQTASLRAYQMIARALRNKDPANPALARAEELLAEAFGDDDAPAEMIALLAELDLQSASTTPKP